MSRSSRRRLARRIEELQIDLSEGEKVSILTINNLDIRALIKFLHLCVEEDRKQASVFNDILDIYIKTKMKKKVP